MFWPLATSEAANRNCSLFAGQQTLGVDLCPYSVAISDLGGDSDNDLAVANGGIASVSVLLNNGDGSFAPHVAYAVGPAPTSVAAGDLDGDDYADLAVADHGIWPLYCRDVSILLNNGNGTFAHEVLHDIGHTPFSVAIGDLDGDNDNDLAVTHDGAKFGDSFVSVLLNLGNAVFDPPTQYDTGDRSCSVALGDLDGDDDLDLAVGNADSDDVSVLLNNGDGTFADHVTYGVGISPVSVAIADVDGDEDLDLAAANSGGNNVSVLLNNGDATFASHVVYDTGTNPSAVVLGDLDADGDADLAVTNWDDNDVSVLLNNADGTFATHGTYGLGSGPSSLAVADLDGDGYADLAAANYWDDDVSILLNLGLYVRIVDQPVPRNVLEGTAVTFSVVASGAESLSYQWRRNAVALVDDGRISGATTPTVMIDPVELSDAGDYDAVVTNACGSVTSATATLTVNPVDCPNPGASGNYCMADCYPNNGDGIWDYPVDGDCIVNIQDLGQLLSNYGMTIGATREDGDVYPLPDGDGAVNLQDLGELLAQYGDNCD